MELNIIVYQFSKKENSTKQVSGSGKPMAVVWEQPYDVVSPTLTFRGDIQPTDNYCYITEFGRYYWMTVESFRDSGLSNIKCTCDVLATYKPYLVGQSFFIERSQSNFDSNYKDTMLAVKGSTRRQSTSVTMSGIDTDAFSHFYLEAIGTGSSGSFTNKYIVTKGVMAELAVKALTDPEIIAPALQGFVGMVVNNGKLNEVFQLLADSPIKLLQDYISSWGEARDIGGDNINYMQTNLATPLGNAYNTIVQSVMERFKNPWDCIVTIKGLAISRPQLFPTGTQTQIMLGVSESGCIGRMLYDSMSEEFTTTIDIPWLYSDFRNMSPYTNVFITLPCCGVTRLSSDILYGQTQITAKYKINAVSGSVVGYLECGGVKIGDIGFNISTSVALAQSRESNSNVGEIAQGALWAAAGNPAGYGLIANGIISPDEYHASCRGVTGGYNAYDNKIYLEVVANDTQDPASLLQHGRLCRKILQLSSLSGFVKCGNASADLPATVAEINRVNQYLNNGFYME